MARKGDIMNSEELIATGYRAGLRGAGYNLNRPATPNATDCRARGRAIAAVLADEERLRADLARLKNPRAFARAIRAGHIRPWNETEEKIFSLLAEAY